jgi:cell wall-associated NlpC family hydrolase
MRSVAAKTIGLVAISAALLAFGPTAASASTGGVGTQPERPPTSAPSAGECPSPSGGLVTSGCAPSRKARLIRGKAIAPLGAGEGLLAVIEAANRIRTTPYIWGGGHRLWRSAGYDCSGAVSYALHGGGLLEAPMTSGELMHWGLPGKGRSITVYANPTHAFAVIAGLRWDTVGDATGTGPRWHPEMVPTAGFVARHPPGY